jgi:hypothetical protein
VKKLPLFAIALVGAIPALWFIWIVVGGPMWEGNYGTFQVQVFKNTPVLVMLILTLIVCALLAFMPVLALIFGGGSESLEAAPALAGGGGTAVESDPETDEAVADDPFEDDEDDEGLDDPFAEDDDESDGELDIEGLDEDDIFAEDDDDDEFAFDDE